MKKIHLHINGVIAVLLVTVALLTSCKKLVEIPATPPSSITQEQQFADSATAITAVAGVYAYNIGNGFAYSDGQLTAVTGLSADELSYVPTNDNQQFYNYTLNPLTSGLTSLWANPYKSIYQVNAVLEGVKNSAGLSPAFKKQVTGEMQVVRALYYFNMVNLFGGVPLITTIDFNQTARLPRATKGEVYSQIVTDLTDAVKNLTEIYPSAGRVRPNVYVALALLARVNLYQGNWQSAYNEADSVIKAGIYDVTNTPLAGVFLSGSNEAIWQIPATDGYYGVPDAKIFVPGYPGANPNYLLTTPILNAFEAEDKRKDAWTRSAIINGTELFYPFKYKNVTASTTPQEYHVILRLAEIYLIRAEAAMHLNKLTEALDDVDIVRNRAGLPVSTADPASETEVLDAIMHERRVELFCEWGHRWFDLKRTGRAETVLNTVKSGYTEEAGLYPIPQAQRQLNNQLSQNPGYSN